MNEEVGGEETDSDFEEFDESYLSKTSHQIEVTSNALSAKLSGFYHIIFSSVVLFVSYKLDGYQLLNKMCNQCDSQTLLVAKHGIEEVSFYFQWCSSIKPNIYIFGVFYCFLGSVYLVGKVLKIII